MVCLRRNTGEGQMENAGTKMRTRKNRQRPADSSRSQSSSSYSLSISGHRYSSPAGSGRSSSRGRKSRKGSSSGSREPHRSWLLPRVPCQSITSPPRCPARSLLPLPIRSFLPSGFAENKNSIHLFWIKRFAPAGLWIRLTGQKPPVQVLCYGTITLRAYPVPGKQAPGAGRGTPRPAPG